MTCAPPEHDHTSMRNTSRPSACDPGLRPPQCCRPGIASAARLGRQSTSNQACSQRLHGSLDLLQQDPAPEGGITLRAPSMVEPNLTCRFTKRKKAAPQPPGTHKLNKRRSNSFLAKALNDLDKIKELTA